MTKKRINEVKTTSEVKMNKFTIKIDKKTSNEQARM